MASLFQRFPKHIMGFGPEQIRNWLPTVGIYSVNAGLLALFVFQPVFVMSKIPVLKNYYTLPQTPDDDEDQ